MSSVDAVILEAMTGVRNHPEPTLALTCHQLRMCLGACKAVMEHRMELDARLGAAMQPDASGLVVFVTKSLQKQLAHSHDQMAAIVVAIAEILESGGFAQESEATP